MPRAFSPLVRGNVEVRRLPLAEDILIRDLTARQIQRDYRSSYYEYYYGPRKGAPLGEGHSFTSPVARSSRPR